MADVTASPDKLVVEGELRLWCTWESQGVSVGDEVILDSIDDWLPRPGDMGKGENEWAYPGTYRITVERLPDTPCCDDADACACDPCACSCSG